MSEADKQKWDKKYAEGAYESKTHPAVFLAEQLAFITAALREARIPEPWRALDLACGAGRNSHFLSTNGFEVDAIDISAVGLARAAENAPPDTPGINWLCRDLDEFDANEFGRYHLIIMMRYVNLPLLKRVTQNLHPGGFILCEKHLRTDESVVGPRNPAFRVAPGELKQALSTLKIHYYEESIITEPDNNKAAVARVLAQQN